MKLSTVLSMLTIGAASAFAPNAPAFTRQSSVLLMAEGDTLTGTVKWFSTQKGFGFIVPDDEDMKDVFVHQTEITMDGFRSLADGERVEFKVESDNTGRSKAVGVTGPDGADVQGAPYEGFDDNDGY